MRFSPFVVPVLGSLLVAAPLLAGPAWLSIELAPNPYDPTTRGALLLARVAHYRQDGTTPVTGRAVGIVAGQRRTMALRFDPTSRPGVFALKPSWGDAGEWTLILTAEPDHGNVAEVMVRVSGKTVTGVEAATRPSRHAELGVEPRRFTEAEIEASLSGRLDTSGRRAP